MPNRRFKSESFENISGINTKANVYLTGPREVLNLRNFDFSTPGSLTKRPGSTMYFGQTFAGWVTDIFEFEKLSGASYLIISHSGGIWAGATPLSGWSFMAESATYFAGVNPLETLYGSTTIGTTLIATIAVTGPNYSIWNGSAFPQSTQGQPQGITLVGRAIGGVIYNPIQLSSPNFEVYQDNVYAYGSNMSLRFNGTTFYNAVPPVPAAANHTMAGRGPGSTTGFACGYVYAFFAALVNDRGARGPIACIGSIDAAMAAGASVPSSFDFDCTILAPKWYGVTAIDVLVWRGSTDSIVSASQTKHFTTMFLDSPYDAGGVTTPIWQNFWTVSHGISLWSALPPMDESIYPTYRLGETTLSSFIFKNSAGATITRTSVWVDTNQNQPRFSEINQNRLFMAGFSSAPSTVWFSELAEPENIDPTFNFEARTNDGDVVTCLKVFQNSLMVFKSRSTHQLDGDAPENFTLRQITAEYGCVNNNAATTWKQKIWFLDRKGIVEYNGAAIDVVSTKIESIINTINWSAAKTTAIMMHNKPRNEIWVGVPVNGSSTNNVTLIFDYIMEAWTIYDGFSPSCFAMLRRNFNIDTGFYGDYTGRVNYFGSSLMGDNGAGITTLVKFRYEHPEGQSVEKQFRRAFYNADSLLGSSTFNLTAEYFKNYSASLVLTQTIAQTKFQKYINFGIPAKSLSIQVSHYSAADAIRLYGYVLVL